MTSLVMECIISALIRVSCEMRNSFERCIFRSTRKSKVFTPKVVEQCERVIGLGERAVTNVVFGSLGYSAMYVYEARAFGFEFLKGRKEENV